MQDITVEPVARLIVDYLSCLYSEREPKAWIRLMNQLIPFADEGIQSSARKDLDQLIRKQRKIVFNARSTELPFSDWWQLAIDFLKYTSIETLVALSPEYENRKRLKEVIRETSIRIQDLLRLEPDLLKALGRFTDDQAVRILTIHKSKGLEFDSVIIMAVENEIFFGSKNENRCAFFVGVSRAKRRLVLTHAQQRERPLDAKRWDVKRSAQEEYFNYVKPFVNG
ncbi:3'-5' exonuclease [Providencia rettgeri]